MTRRRWVMAAAAALLAGACAVIVLSSTGGPAAGARTTAVDTEQVQRGPLSAQVSGAGTLTYRARSDGAPYAVINQAHGVYTQLPEAGDKIGCGGVLYRVDERPIVLLCGAIPAYRTLHAGLAGTDVRQLNRNLHRLGYDAAAHVPINPDDDTFTSATEQALERASAQDRRCCDRPARDRRCRFPTRCRPDREGRRSGRRIGRARCWGAERHIGRALRAARTRSVAAGRGQDRRPGPHHAAREQAGDGAGHGVRASSSA